MSKLILLLILVFIAYLFYKGFRRAGSARVERGDPAQPVAERMVACARCGVHLPESESLQSDDGYFCSEEHRRLGAA